jgi:hypothetical protein
MARRASNFCAGIAVGGKSCEPRYSWSMGRLHRGALRALPLLGALVNACAALTGVNDLSELPDAGTSDGGPLSDVPFPENDANTAESTGGDSRFADSTAADGTGGDALEDSTPPDHVDAQPIGPWCATQSPPHTICSDFDEGALDAGWSSVVAVAGATLTEDGTTSTSPPNSLLTTAPPEVADAGPREGRLWATFANVPSVIDLAFDLRPEQLPSGCHGWRIDFDSGYTLRYDVTGSQILESGPTQDGGSYGMSYSLTSNPPVGAWTHVMTHLVLTSPRTISVTMGSGPALTNQPFFAVFQDSPFKLGVGVYLSTGDCQLRYDNVTVDVQ